MATEPIAVVPYDAEWPGRFETERALFEGVLALWLDGGIHHIGSTAIPGIAAKPIIDMMAECEISKRRAGRGCRVPAEGRQAPYPTSSGMPPCRHGGARVKPAEAARARYCCPVYKGG